jgi:hypothetical protein
MLAAFRTLNGTYTLFSFVRGWVTLMTPLAMLSWVISRSVLISVLSFAALPLFGVFQGVIQIITYRCFNVGCPHPKTPAHGVVVVNPQDATQCEVLGNVCRCTCTAGRRWRRGAVSRQEEIFLEQALQLEPLHLLVIGDSLALGLGTTSSCTAILPEVIAKVLSKSLRRPVYWTSHGSAGASSGWIVQELQREMRNNYRPPNVKPALSEPTETTDDSSDEGSADENSMGGVNDEESTYLKEWRSRLENFRAAGLNGPFDVVVVLTGANDVKGTLFPFSIRGEELRFLQDAQRQGFSLTIELEHILKCIRPRADTLISPLVVFPALPTALLPIFRNYPVRWHAVPVMGIMESQKKKLAETHDDCLFVEAPNLAGSVDFEAQKGEYWERRIREDTLIALRDVSRQECEHICSAMKKYCDRKGDMPLYPNGVKSQANVPEPPLCHRNGFADGSKVVFIDKIHPNDEGFDFWGRHIADGILRQWPVVEMCA